MLVNKRKEEMTGYPSVDKPWLKYYSEEEINSGLPNCSVYDYMYENNKDYLDDVALIYFGRKMTFRYLCGQIDLWAQEFLSKGVSKGDVVSILSITSPEIVFIFYALAKIGAVANMLDPRMRVNTLKEKITVCDSKYYVSMDIFNRITKEIVGCCDINECWVINIYDSMPFAMKLFMTIKSGIKHSNKSKAQRKADSKQRIHYNCGETDGENVVLIEYTGGTTGSPKGVMLSNNQINSVVSQYKRSGVPLKRGQLWQTVSAPFIAYVMIASTHIPLCCGIICNITIYDPDNIAKDIVKNNYNHIAGNPAVWNKVIFSNECTNKDFSELLMPITGADAMPEDLWKKANKFLSEHNCKNVLCNGYGMTELASAVAVNLSPDVFKMGSVGIPFIDTTISSFDEENHELEINQIGEICVSGPSIMSGYIDNKKETDEIVMLHSDGKKWLHTGDYGYIDADGFVFIVGRIKRMIIRENGAKVFPMEIENLLTAHRSVDACCVVGVKDENASEGAIPVAFIVLNPSVHISDEMLVESELKDICEKNLPKYEHPVKYCFIDELPLTPIGKIDYKNLEQQALRR